MLPGIPGDTVSCLTARIATINVSAKNKPEAGRGEQHNITEAASNEL